MYKIGLSVSLVVIFIFIILKPIAASSSTWFPKSKIILPLSLIKSLQEKNDTVNILLTMTMRDGGGIINLLNKNENWPKPNTPPAAINRTRRIQILKNILKNEADSVQKNLLDFLSQENSLRSPQKLFEVRQLWISNQIIVKGADFRLVQQLLERRDISRIEEETFIPLLLPQNHKDHGGQTWLGHAFSPIELDDSYPWSISAVSVPAVWQNGTKGKGIVVASIDTGARVSHEALKDNYRKDHGWFDPQHHSTAPYDGNGHGTHTLGTILGRTRSIGVAPESQWIACRGCGMDVCSAFDLLECGQWVLCPADYQGQNADCTKAPHVVSNSWGGGSIKYDRIITAWREAGIIPIFSIGNDGPACATTLHPGNHPDVIGVGSTKESGHVSDFSSFGPLVDGSSQRSVKPDIAAPGSNILSAWTTTDTAYVTESGTSMACPMVAGLVALMLSRDEDLDYVQIKGLLQAGAQETHSTGRDCGQILETSYPNNHVGFGQVDAYNSVVRKGPGPHIGSAGSFLGSPSFRDFFLIFSLIFFLPNHEIWSNLLI